MEASNGVIMWTKILPKRGNKLKLRRMVNVCFAVIPKAAYALLPKINKCRILLAV